jgi:hypothetical protein
MSYNVTDFTIKKMENLTLPLAELNRLAERQPHIDVSTNVLTYDEFGLECMEIIGTRENDRLIVFRLMYFGEGSGWWWDNFEGLLQQSTGYLRALVVWEGGDTVEYITVTNGAIERETL